MKLLSLICVVIASGSTPAPLSTTVHTFEDGFVERSMAIVVRDRSAHVEYSIGLNESTVREVLVKWEPGADPSDSATPDVNRRALTDPLPVAPDESIAPSTDSKQVTVTSNGLESPGPMKVDATGKSTSTQPSESRNPIDGHAISPELLAKFKELAPDAIVKAIDIRCNGEKIEAFAIKEGPPPRHPFTITIELEFELPDSEICDLKINDHNFADQKGAARFSLKAAGRSMLIRSDVAPILVRAERIELSKVVSESERNSLTSINARLGIAPPRKP